MHRIDVDDVLEQLGRLVVRLPRNVVIDILQQRGHVPRIHFQRGFQRLHRHAAIAVGVRASAPAQQIRILRQLLEPFVIRARRQGEIVLLHRQLAAGEVHVAQFRVGLLRRR